MNPLLSSKIKGINGDITVPGDKSISHRALMLASMAVGKTTITGLLESEDVINTAKALKALGVKIDNKSFQNHKSKIQNPTYIVNGVGTGGLTEPDNVLDMGNSGTGVRLLMGLVASHRFPVTFTGDDSLRGRPMKRVITPLEEMGAKISARDGGKLPLTVTGSDYMLPITYKLPVASAQVKSAILLAALNIPGKTKVIEPELTRNHTELMMRYLGVDIETNDNEITITGQPELIARDINVPADPSSAAFLVVAALITKTSCETIRNVCINPLRIGLYETLLEMGADIKFTNRREEAGEQIADIVVSSSKLKGVVVPANRAPSMIDEYPILSIAASVAEGKTVMKGLQELRVKESDRLSAIYEGLKACGVSCEATEDSLTVAGGSSIAGGAIVKTHMDHRIAMSFLILGMVAENPITVDDSSMINTSFPGFVNLVNGVGAKIGVRS